MSEFCGKERGAGEGWHVAACLPPPCHGAGFSPGCSGLEAVEAAWDGEGLRCQRGYEVTWGRSCALRSWIVLFWPPAVSREKRRGLHTSPRLSCCPTNTQIDRALLVYMGQASSRHSVCALAPSLAFSAAFCSQRCWSQCCKDAAAAFSGALVGCSLFPSTPHCVWGRLGTSVPLLQPSSPRVLEGSVLRTFLSPCISGSCYPDSGGLQVAGWRKMVGLS